MALVFITGSTDGLGRAAAVSLLDAGHQVVLHARSMQRAEAIGDLRSRAAAVAIGDLSVTADIDAIANQVNAVGRMDAIIHNAGVYSEPSRGSTPEGRARTVAINTLAPYLLTARLHRPDRLVFISSGLHRGGEGPLDDLDWTRRPWDPARAYAESKLHVVALTLALARRWPKVLSNAVDPGWVRTRMGGAGAPVDLETGQRTQSWLAVSKDPAALVSGQYWHHLRREAPAGQALDPAFQDQLIAKLAELTGVSLADE
ncbi:SDR family NAD(P)-dependent oxidoreductase [Bradyrhizobium sp. HKCCYLS2038]|uniref:SDR family NAD(P)-dependent oxidoreductase n=1 Tax=unclassified Bradyrhizobium TaxID=2631580 RepID=UPI003EB7BE09